MPSILIDANIYLGFWKLREGRLQSELLPALLELHDEILVSKQIVDEVARNRLSVFLTEAQLERLVEPPALPNHLLGDEAARTWNEQHKAAMKQLKDLKKDWDKVLRKLAKAIAEGSDPVSHELASLFKAAVPPTDEQLRRARDRRERGNPPGKKTDPLGDQLSWEQFLDSSKAQRHVWIISRDSDYFNRIDKETFELNPLMRRDLIERNKDLQIHVFDNLASAIVAIKKAGIVVEKSPSSNRLTELEKELATTTVRSAFPVGFSRTVFCPTCDSMNEIPLFGHTVYMLNCQNCGAPLDVSRLHPFIPR